jgi:hypothetical protein
VIATDDDSLPRRRNRQPGKPNKDSKAQQLSSSYPALAGQKRQITLFD